MVKKLFVACMMLCSIWACSKKEEPFVPPIEEEKPEYPTLADYPEDSVLLDLDYKHIDILRYTIERMSKSRKFYEIPEEEREQKIINALRHLRANKPELGYALFVVQTENFTDEYYKRNNSLSALSFIVKQKNIEDLPFTFKFTISNFHYTYRDFKHPYYHWVNDAYLYTYAVESWARSLFREGNYEKNKDCTPLELYEVLGWINKREKVEIEKFVREKYPEKAEWILSNKGFFVPL